MSDFAVTVAAGSLRSAAPDALRMPHRWTADGVTVAAEFTGAHLLHLSVAGCVLNDLYREAQQRDIELDGVRVVVRGGFDADAWNSTGITYAVEVDSAAPTEDLARLVARVDEVAEIPRALRAGTTVTRGL